MNHEHRVIIEQLLAQKTGMEIEKIGTRQLAKAIAARQKACGLTEVSDYLQHLKTSAQEFQDFVEQIVIRETWFFRHREAFSLLRDYVKTQWLPRNPQGKLRILSVPCSTGEEPYSIAMTLLNRPLSSQQLYIEGMDISTIALNKAKQGIYGKNSFRSHDWVDHQQFFEETEQGYQVRGAIRQQVKFRVKNLVHLWAPNHPPYDIIFCRHLLIYLDETARDRVIKTLARLLSDQGLLFVGAVETTLIKLPGFRFMPHPSAFAYQKVADPPPKILTTLPIAPQKLTPNKLQTNAPVTTQQPDSQFSLLEIARQQANQGNLEEAAQFCDDYLKRFPVDASVYLLLGEIYQAQGDNEQAQRYLQKALYLNPNCREALVHLVLMRESQGDTKGAAILKNRIQRLDNLQE